MGRKARTMTDLLAEDLERGEVNQRNMLMAEAEQVRELAVKLREEPPWIGYEPHRQREFQEEMAQSLDSVARFLDRHSLLHSFTDRLVDVPEGEVEVLLAKIRSERLGGNDGQG